MTPPPAIPTTPRIIDAETIAAHVRPRDAVDTLRRVLREGFDPAADHARTAVPTENGEFLLMPSTSSTAFGIKLLSVAPEGYNPDLPRIQGTYAFFDGETLSPSAFIDGITLTNLRTPAVSVACILDLLTASSEPLDAVIFGAGVQADAHAATLRDTLAGVRPVRTTFISRTDPGDGRTWHAAGSAEAQSATAGAELIITTTTASEPILDAADVRTDALIVAVGSHTPDARELPSELISAAQVIVEDHEATLREGGDVILAIADGAADASAFHTFAEVVRGDVELHRDSPIVFKFTGMPWEDLAVAETIAAAIPAPSA